MTLLASWSALCTGLAVTPTSEPSSMFNPPTIPSRISHTKGFIALPRTSLCTRKLSKSHTSSRLQPSSGNSSWVELILPLFGSTPSRKRPIHLLLPNYLFLLTLGSFVRVVWLLIRTDARYVVNRMEAIFVLINACLRRLLMKWNVRFAIGV